MDRFGKCYCADESYFVNSDDSTENIYLFVF